MALFNLLIVDATGTTVDTITLATGGNLLLKFGLQSPQPRSIEYTSPLKNGSVIGVTTRPDVTESATIMLVTASAAATSALIAEIEQAFNTAEKRQETKRGNRVYVEFKPEGAATSYRSEIKRGQLNITEQGLDEGWIQNKVTIVLTYLRAWYWESTTRTELYLASRRTNRATGGVEIMNVFDDVFLTDGTYVDIDDGDITGVVDTPIELWYTNTYDSGTRPFRIMVGHQILGAPTSFNPVLEGEAGTWTNGTATIEDNDIGDIGSGGHPGPNTWSSLQMLNYEWVFSTEGIVASWTLTSAQLSYIAGANVRFLAKFTAAAPDIKIILRIKYQSLTLLDQTMEVTTDSHYIQDLGVMQIPPWIGDGAGSYPLVLQLYVRKEGGGEFNLDYLYMLPMDGFVEYRAQGYGLPYNYTLKDNATDGWIIVTAGGDTGAGFFVKRPREGIMLRPGVTQRLHFILPDLKGLDRSATIRAFYRERRLTV